MNASKSAVPQKCISCNAQLTSPIVCQGCHTLYPLPQSVDYFGLLGLERRYDIDASALQARFVSVSRQVHPDYFTNAGSEMAELATRLSAELNDAVKVLKDPILRAGYLLETCGGPRAADDRTVPGDVLAEALMLREEIEEAQSAGNREALAGLRRAIEQKREHLADAIAELARMLPDTDDAHKTQLRHTINSVKYYNNMLDLLWTD